MKKTAHTESGLAAPEPTQCMARRVLTGARAGRRRRRLRRTLNLASLHEAIGSRGGHK